MGATTDPKDDLQRLVPWLPEFERVCREESQDLADLCALCLRESLASWAPGYSPVGTHVGFGDGWRAFGLFQVDFRFWESAIRGIFPGPDLLTVRGQAMFACMHLASSRRVLAAAFPLLSAPAVERAALAAYNAGLGKVAAQLAAGHDPDAVTTPGPTGRPDYSLDVQRRAAVLRRRNAVLFPPPAG